MNTITKKQVTLVLSTLYDLLNNREIDLNNGDVRADIIKAVVLLEKYNNKDLYETISNELETNKILH